MRIVFAHDHIFSRYGDEYYSPGRLPYSAWQRYLKHFDEVIVLARVQSVEGTERVANLQRADGPGVSFVELPAARGARRLFERFGSTIEQAISEADALVARVPSEIGIAAMATARGTGITVACEVVASAWNSLWYHGAILPKLYAPLLEWRTRRYVETANFALYVTREYLQKRYPCRGKRASASNVTVTMQPDVEAKRERRISQSSRSLTVGFVGSLHAEYKGLDVAIEAVARAVHRTPDLVLQVVGEGPTTRWAEYASRRGIGHRVQFLGALPGSAAVLEWLDEVDIYVHPSRAEGLPRSLIEAMSRGCFCIGSNVGGIPELLTAEHLHNPWDGERLSQLILQGTSAEERRIALAENVRVAEAYSFERLEASRFEFFADVARHAAACASSRASSARR